MKSQRMNILNALTYCFQRILTALTEPEERGYRDINIHVYKLDVDPSFQYIQHILFLSLKLN